MASRWMMIATIGMVAVGLFFVPRSTTAQSAGMDPSNLAVVDMTRVFNDCKQTQALNEHLKKLAGQFETETKAMQNKIEQKGMELDAFARGTKEYNERFKQWMDMQVKLNTSIRLQQRNLLRDQTHWTRTTYKKAVQAVENLAKARGLAMVFYKDEMDLGTDDLKELESRLRGRKIIYSAGGLDITQAVIEALDRDFEATGGIKIPSAK